MQPNPSTPATPNRAALIAAQADAIASARHTPGPLTWSPAPGMGLRYHFISGLRCGETLIHIDEDEARLFAAAPELLEAAQSAEAVLGRQKWLEGSTDPEAVALFKLRAAIAKATGSAA